MNAFKLDLMTVLALFVILAVIVTMMLGSNDNDKTNIGSFSQPTNSTVLTVSSVTPVSSESFSYRASQAVTPASKFVSRSWR